MTKCDCCGNNGDKLFMGFKLCANCCSMANRLRDGETEAAEYWGNYEFADSSADFKKCIDDLFEKNAVKLLMEEDKKRIAAEKIQNFEEQRRFREEQLRDIEAKRKTFMCTTGYNFEGYKITQYIGVVTNEALVGTGLFSELSSQLNDLFGLESLTNKSKLSKSKETALNRMIDDAILMGANAIIGIDYDIMTFTNDTIVTSVNGTAVRIEKE